MNVSDINTEKYKFQTDGKVWSEHKQDYLKGKQDRDGYTLFELSSKDGKFHTYKLHRILAELYCEIPSGYTIDELEVDHIKPISEGGTNDVSNLRWVTPKQNHNNPNTLLNKSKAMRNKQSMSKVVQQFKGAVTKEIHQSVWQKSFHDRIIRNEKEYSKIYEYIDNNPLKWEEDCFYITS